MSMIKPAPVLRYPGAKWNLAEWIVSHMPAHRSYVEPYFGSGALFFTKPKSPLETANDINGHVVNLFRVMRERPEALAAAVEFTPFSRCEYELSYDRDLSVLDPVEAARRFLVRTWQGHGSAAEQYRNGWSIVRQEEKSPGRPLYRQWRNLPNRVLAAADRLKEAHIECRPAVEVIQAFAAPETLIYADPPYPTSVLSAKSKGRKIYDDVMTDAEHEEMLTALVSHPGYALLSNYACELYDDVLIPAGWTYETKRASTEKGGSREEILWLNPTARESLKGRLW